MYVLLIGRPDAQAVQLFRVLMGIAPQLTLRVRPPQLALQDTGERPALVVCDAGCSGLAALTVLSQLRKRPGWQSVPMAVLTDAPTCAQMTAALHLKAAYAVKPVADTDLAWMCSRLMDLAPALPVVAHPKLPDLAVH